MLKKLLMVSALLSLTSIAHASILTLTGKDVVYSINTDADWYQGLVASVSGDALTFRRVDGGAVLAQSLQLSNRVSETWNTNWTDIRVVGRNGARINGITSELNASSKAAVMGVNPVFGAFASSLFFAYNNGSNIGGSEAALASYANDSSGLIKKISNDDPVGTLGTEYHEELFGNHTQSFSQQLSGINLKFAGYAELFKVGGGTVSLTINDFGVTTNVVPVPEPESYALLGLGLLGVFAARRRKKS